MKYLIFLFFITSLYQEEITDLCNNKSENPHLIDVIKFDIIKPNDSEEIELSIIIESRYYINSINICSNNNLLYSKTADKGSFVYNEVLRLPWSNYGNHKIKLIIVSSKSGVFHTINKEIIIEKPQNVITPNPEKEREIVNKDEPREDPGSIVVNMPSIIKSELELKYSECLGKNKKLQDNYTKYQNKNKELETEITNKNAEIHTIRSSYDLIKWGTGITITILLAIIGFLLKLKK